MGEYPNTQIVPAQTDGYGYKCPVDTWPLTMDNTKCFENCTYNNIQRKFADCMAEGGTPISALGKPNICCAPPPPADSVVANPDLHPLLNLAPVNTDDTSKPYCATGRHAVVSENGQSKNACFTSCKMKTKNIIKDPIMGCLNNKLVDEHAYTEQVNFPFQEDAADPTCCSLDTPPSCKPGLRPVPITSVPPAESPHCAVNTDQNGWCCTKTTPTPSDEFITKCGALKGRPALATACGEYSYPIKTATKTDKAFCCVPAQKQISPVLQKTCQTNHGKFSLCGKGPGKCPSTTANGVHVECETLGPYCCTYQPTPTPGPGSGPNHQGPHTAANCTSLHGELKSCKTGDTCVHNATHACENGQCCEVQHVPPVPKPGPPQCPAGQVPEACHSGTAGCVNGYKCTHTSPPVAVASSHSYPGHMWLCVGAFGAGLVIALVLSLIRRRKK